jgi:hypothetical protein
MATQKLLIRNVSSNIILFNYQNSSDGVWYYQIAIQPGQERTIWCVENTLSYSGPRNGLTIVDKTTTACGITPTPTPTPTITPTVTPTVTPTTSVTPTVTPTASVTPTPTVTETPTNTPTPTITETPTNTPTETVTPTPTETTPETPTPTPTESVTPTVTPTITPTSETPTPTPTETVTPTPTLTSVICEGNCYTAEVYISPTDLLSASGNTNPLFENGSIQMGYNNCDGIFNTISYTMSGYQYNSVVCITGSTELIFFRYYENDVLTYTELSTLNTSLYCCGILPPTPTPTGTPAETPAETPTPTPTGTPAETPAETPTPTPTGTPAETPAETPTPTPTGTPAETPAETPTPTPTETTPETPTPTPTESVTPTVTPTETVTPTPTETTPETPTPTPTETVTPTPTVTETPTNTPTPTITPTSETPTPTPTNTVTPTVTPTSGGTPTFGVGDILGTSNSSPFFRTYDDTLVEISQLTSVGVTANYGINASDNYQYSIAAAGGSPPLQVKVSTDYGDSYSTPIGVGSAYLGGTLISKNGQYMYVESGTTFLRSNDFGTTFSSVSLPITINTFIQSSVSWNGQYVIIATFGPSFDEFVLLSTDYGITFTNITLNIFPSQSVANSSNIQAVAVSGNGLYMMLMTASGDSYRSTDFGVTWGIMTIVGQDFNEDFKLSYDGRYGIVSAASNKVITTNDFGVSWTTNTFSSPISNTDISNSGQYMLATLFGGSQTQISSDYGATWTLYSSTNKNYLSFIN